MLKETEIIKEIIDIFSREKMNIQSQCKAGLFDDNKYWENIIRYLMNAIYGFDLKNLNEEQINYPGIDLGDQSEKIGVQVTETKTSAKLVRSLNRVLENKVYEVYPKFCMFVLGDKQKTYSFDANKYEGKIIFDPSSDIYDFQNLINEINKMNREEMQDILNYLKMEFSEKRTDEIRQNIVYVLSYLDASWKWIELAKERGLFLTDAYRCREYSKRYEIISGCLSKEESSKLIALLTDINQLIDYMEEGFRYIHERTKGKKRISGLTSYVDSYTIGLSHSIMGKAEEVLNNRSIYEVIKKKII